MKLINKSKIIWLTVSGIVIFAIYTIIFYFIFSTDPNWGDFFLNFGTELIGVVVSIIVAVIIFEAYDKKRWKPVEKKVARRAQRYIDWHHLITMEYFNMEYKKEVREALARGRLA